MNPPLILWAFLLAALTPPAAALYLVRRHIGGPWSLFWRPFANGLFGVTLVLLVAIAAASAYANGEAAKCIARPDGPSRDCGEIMLLIPTVGVLGIFALLVYFIAGIVMQAVRRSSRR